MNDLTQQEQKILNLCREWYRTAKDITKQTLWYEIGVMLENEQPAVPAPDAGSGAG